PAAYNARPGWSRKNCRWMPWFSPLSSISVLDRASPFDRKVPVSSWYKIKPPPAFITEGQLVADLRIGNHKALVRDIGNLLPILFKGQLLVRQFCREGVPDLSQFNERSLKPDILFQKQLVRRDVFFNLIRNGREIHPDLCAVLGDTGFKILLEIGRAHV